MEEKTCWEQTAELLYEEGVYVDWDERYFICPCCGEPIYECDYTNDPENFADYCPVCFFEDFEFGNEDEDLF